MTDTQLEHEHSHAAIRARLALPQKPSYVRDWVYGGIDGAITTFAIVAGVVGAQLSPLVILILGFANLLADGFSMAAGNYSATKTELEEFHRLRAVEEKHIRLAPEGEREELRQILENLGLTGSALSAATEAITKRPDKWLSLMLAAEYGVTENLRSPIKSALGTFAAFLLCGFVPLVPFLLKLPNPFEISIAATGAVFLLIGSIKSRWSLLPWWVASLETLAIGGVAAGLAYFVGQFLKATVG